MRRSAALLKGWASLDWCCSVPAANPTFHGSGHRLCSAQLAQQGGGIVPGGRALPLHRCQLLLHLKPLPPLSLKFHPQLPQLALLLLHRRRPAPRLGRPA